MSSQQLNDFSTSSNNNKSKFSYENINELAKQYGWVIAIIIAIIFIYFNYKKNKNKKIKEEDSN